MPEALEVKETMAIQRPKTTHNTWSRNMEPVQLGGRPVSNQNPLLACPGRAECRHGLVRLADDQQFWPTCVRLNWRPAGLDKDLMFWHEHPATKRNTYHALLLLSMLQLPSCPAAQQQLEPLAAASESQHVPPLRASAHSMSSCFLPPPRS